jgi:hypothetical protein
MLMTSTSTERTSGSILSLHHLKMPPYGLRAVEELAFLMLRVGKSVIML